MNHASGGRGWRVGAVDFHRRGRRVLGREACYILEIVFRGHSLEVVCVREYDCECEYKCEYEYEFKCV